MSEPHFRIYPSGDRWGWRTLADDGTAILQGIAATRAEAAAQVIRAVVIQSLPADAFRAAA